MKANGGSLPDTEDETPRRKSGRCRTAPCNIGCSGWCRKYFWEGQMLNEHELSKRAALEDLPQPQRFLAKHRRLVAILIPLIITHFCWWGIAIQYNIWHLFPEKYFMSITMIFGSIMAGMTSEGGGAVAFPVMTLAFSISPDVARDFSLMIQSCGMSAAAFTIFFMRVQLEWHSLIFCSLGGVVGSILGFHLVDPRLSPAQKKMGFVSIWFSFAFALFLLNLYHKRKTYKSVPHFGPGKAVILVLTGVMGGIFTSFAGSGLDICSFSILTLLFRVSEKVATPTSVVLMAGNTVVGFYWRGVMMNSISTEAWEFLAVCVPIVVLGAPLGSVLGSHFHRHVLASFVYIIDTLALVGAFVLVKQTPVLAGASVGLIVAGFLFFFTITKLGERLMKKNDRLDEEEEDKSGAALSGTVAEESPFGNDTKYVNGNVNHGYLENGNVNHGYRDNGNVNNGYKSNANPGYTENDNVNRGHQVAQPETVDIRF